MVNPPQLLIVDDDRPLREALASVFLPRGFRTLLAADGRQALEIIQRQPVHLLLVDMHMPQLTGLETIKQVRRHRAMLPWILISAALDETISAEARSANAFRVLKKPVAMRELTGAVDEAMQANYNWRLRN